MLNTCPMCRYYDKPGFIINAWQIVPCFQCNQNNSRTLRVPNCVAETVEGQMRANGTRYAITEGK